MIVPWLTFIAVGLITYAGFVKLAARLLSYTVPWKSSFLFAGIVLVLVIFDHVLAFDQPVAIRFVHIVVLLLVLVILGSWFFSTRGMNRSGTLPGWGGGIRLIAVAFAMMVVLALAIVLPAHVFLSNHFSTSP
jgi:hypothetical protein